MISPKLLLARSGSFWMKSGSSETREGPFNSEPNTSGPCSNEDLTTAPFSEIAELMSVKSKHGAGGEYTPEWAPKVRWFEFFLGFHVWLKYWKARTTSDATTGTSSSANGRWWTPTTSKACLAHGTQTTREEAQADYGRYSCATACPTAGFPAGQTRDALVGSMETYVILAHL